MGCKTIRPSASILLQTKSLKYPKDRAIGQDVGEERSWKEECMNKQKEILRPRLDEAASAMLALLLLLLFVWM